LVAAILSEQNDGYYPIDIELNDEGYGVLYTTDVFQHTVHVNINYEVLEADVQTAKANSVIPYDFEIYESNGVKYYAMLVIILANPPFGGKERKEIQQNFNIKTGETAFLFLQHFIKYLKAGGRGAVVIKNTFLSDSKNASKALRQELLEGCNLHTVLDCPGGTFLGAGVKTVVLHFEKGAPTRKIWYYQLDPGRNMGKTNSLNDDDLKEFVELQATFADSDKSWTVNAEEIDKSSFDISVKNPNKLGEALLRDPQKILKEIATLDAESEKVLERIRGII